MQLDMHFYGTYAIARAAGIPQQDSRIIAYAAQFVDDSTKQDSARHEDGGLLYGIATAHHPEVAGWKAFVNYFLPVIYKGNQRRIWVPFHFIPGGEGETFEEKLLCVKDSKIANEMMEHHIESALDSPPFGLHLLGIGAHVYMDTFAHYGFSGISSDYNAVDVNSLNILTKFKNDTIKKHIERRRRIFLVNEFCKWSFPTFESCYIIIKSWGAEKLSRALGHGGVLTHPDRPFLHWQVMFSKPRPGNLFSSDRDNPSTFLEGCGKLHAHLSRFANKHYPENHPVLFDDIKEKVDAILRFEGDKEQRIKQWTAAFKENTLFQSSKGEADFEYKHDTWEDQKKSFHNLSSSSKGLYTDAYRFHQAAALHRYYVLKELLPGHGIAVY